MKLPELLARAEGLVRDIDFTPVRRWKGAVAGRKAIGYMPVFAPREIIHAAGMLPVGVFGGGDQMEIIRGDACFQSYICHIPRSTVELALSGRLSGLDGMIFPSTCDVIRNLSGIWKILLPGVYARYLDVPQNFDRAVGGRYFEAELRALATDLARIGGRELDPEALRASIRTFNLNRRLTPARSLPSLCSCSVRVVPLYASSSVISVSYSTFWPRIGPFGRRPPLLKMPPSIPPNEIQK